MSINWQENFYFTFLGGLGLFLYSIKTWETVCNKLLEIAFVFTLTNIPAIRSSVC